MAEPLPTVIFETIHGSRAYGLATEGSDTDIKGVIVGPRGWYFGCHDSPTQINLTKDHVRYELRKFIRLALAANPSIFEVLFAPASKHLSVTPAGERLLDARDAFLSRRVAATFGGYALSQLKRIRSHRRWLLEPPAGPPDREAFGLPRGKALRRDQIGALDALTERGSIDAEALSPNFLALLDRERGYQAARREWSQYQTWRKQRNPARAKLEAKFGYDTKHALHLVRLLRMGFEILSDGEVRVHRADRDELLAIRAGAWSYDELITQAEALHERLQAAAQTSSLPEAPDEEGLGELCVSIIEGCLSARGHQ